LLAAGASPPSHKQEECTGTVHKTPNFDAESDCRVLKKAMKGWGTDENSLIAILGDRTTDELQVLKKMYKTMHGKDLEKELMSELSGDLKYTVKLLMMSRAERDSYCLSKAMAGLGTDEMVLIEILTSRSNQEIEAISSVFEKHNKRSLEAALRSETSATFKKLLTALCQGNRNESAKVDLAKASLDAQTLKKSGEDKWGTDESEFILILCTRSLPQLKATFLEYQRNSKHRSMVDAIESEFSGDLRRGLKAIVEIAMDKQAYFAHRLYRSMKGLGTDDKTLARLVTTRYDVDMVQIKQRFHQKYNQSLGQFIHDDTSGDYRKLLLKLVGGVQTF